jgi:hypothetical protein
MPKRPAIPGLRDAMKKTVTRPEQVLAEMEKLGHEVRSGLLQAKKNRHKVEPWICNKQPCQLAVSLQLGIRRCPTKVWNWKQHLQPP